MEKKLVDAIVSEDWCPKCLGELDTGWECNDCGFDARPIAYPEGCVEQEQKRTADG